MTASVTPIRPPSNDDGTYDVPLPTPNILDGFVASMELTQALMRMTPQNMRQHIQSVATPAEFREHLKTMQAAAEWSAGCSEMIGLARDRLAEVLTLTQQGPQNV